MFSKHLKIVDVILASILNLMKNVENTAEVYPDSDREIQADE